MTSRSVTLKLKYTSLFKQNIRQANDENLQLFPGFLLSAARGGQGHSE